MGVCPDNALVVQNDCSMLLEIHFPGSPLRILNRASLAFPVASAFILLSGGVC